IIPSAHDRASSTFYICASAHPRGLPSFPTRRSSDLSAAAVRRLVEGDLPPEPRAAHWAFWFNTLVFEEYTVYLHERLEEVDRVLDRKSTRLNSSHRTISYAVFCLKKKKKNRRFDSPC